MRSGKMYDGKLSLLSYIYLSGRYALFEKNWRLEQAILSPQNTFSRSYQINDLLSRLCNQRAKDYMEGSGQLGLND